MSMINFDFESSTQRLSLAVENGIDHYCFLIQDPSPYNQSNFYWYPSIEALFESLNNDLYATLFKENEVSDIQLFINEVAEIVNDLKKKKTPVFLELAKRIQDIWLEFSNPKDLEFAFIGTYEMLLSGDGVAERTIRNKFRNGESENYEFNGKPVKDHEVDAFNDFISGEN